MIEFRNVPGIFGVDIEPAKSLPMDEFWRDAEATNRCDDPKKATQFLSSLIVRRARWECMQQPMHESLVRAWIESRAAELWHECRRMGFPAVTILGIIPVITCNFPD